ncbi:hypothetical protein BB560_001363 [Smittium megazygosporum]|uniref:Uncharacterized protein n=1 Tax=Smittium megazygosporum TaxID=133381 RepID=A0A2T9ZHR1_9FUNG|nr:hypothetical protein BB560_001363 [Smittium megazygosporum]
MKNSGAQTTIENDASTRGRLRRGQKVKYISDSVERKPKIRKNEIQEISPEDFFAAEKVDTKPKKEKPSPKKGKRKIEDNGLNTMLTEGQDLKEVQKATSHIKPTKKKAKTADNEAVNKAISLGVNIRFGKDLEDVPKSSYKPWDMKGSTGPSSSRPAPISSPNSLET